MDAKAIVSNIASLASAAHLVSHLSGFASAAAVAESGLELVDEVTGTLKLDAEDVASLDTSRELFEATVNAHANKTAASLD